MLPPRRLLTIIMLLGCGQRPSPGVAPAPIHSGVAMQLRGVGLDPSALPTTIAGVPASAMNQVMTTFVSAVGIDCNGCHDPNDAARAQLHITSQMWSVMVAQLHLADGGTLYCDSCHQGRATFLDRSDSHALGLWMQANFVDGIVRTDHKQHDCYTCHGSPFNATFLDNWAMGKTR
jgi:hypothetical protein